MLMRNVLTLLLSILLMEQKKESISWCPNSPFLWHGFGPGVELRIWLKQGKEKKTPGKEKKTPGKDLTKRVNVCRDKIRQKSA